jgi:peptide deformylase
MALLPVRLYPDPVLRARAAPVERFDAELRRLVRDMIDTMHAAPGVGLAAPQVGVEQRVAVVDLSVGERPEELHVLINPEILSAAGSVVEVEGCLSIPGISEKVERPAAVAIVASDLNGASFELSGTDLLARALCHEIDHLDGILFPDRLRGLRRERVRRALRRLERDAERAAVTA